MEKDRNNMHIYNNVKVIEKKMNEYFVTKKTRDQIEEKKKKLT